MTVSRLTPQVQRIQETSPYINIYTNSPTISLQPRLLMEYGTSAPTHAHPPPKRWSNTHDWGARHIRDTAPFDLWVSQTREFRMPYPVEIEWIHKHSGGGIVGLTGWYMWIETANPPQPVPLTIGCMPVVFVGVGEPTLQPIPNTHYGNDWLPDPCPENTWPRMSFPSKENNIKLLTALQPLANIRDVYYLPNWIVIDLEYGDGRFYGTDTLPGIVAGCTTLYHHSETPYWKSMEDTYRAWRVDPLSYNSTPTPQDTQNYLRNLNFLSPGCRMECGNSGLDPKDECVKAATSAGVKLRRGDGKETLTVSYHGFKNSSTVFHASENEDMIGVVFECRPELDVSLVTLNPNHSAKFTNSRYFKAQTPTKLIPGSEIRQGTWAEVDGMSSGLVSLIACGVVYMRPERLPGSPDVDYSEWKAQSIEAIFGAVNESICEGMRGAPIVRVDSGQVSGLFSLADGLNCFSPHLDDLVAEGWKLA